MCLRRIDEVFAVFFFFFGNIPGPLCSLFLFSPPFFSSVYFPPAQSVGIDKGALTEYDSALFFFFF